MRSGNAVQPIKWEWESESAGVDWCGLVWIALHDVDVGSFCGWVFDGRVLVWLG
jgi:hypothetical protein